MKRAIIALVVVAIAVVAFLNRGRWLPQPAGHAHYLGYVEGDTILVGAAQAGRIVERPVEKGAAVQAGAALFGLDPAIADSEVDRAAAALQTAEAQLANLMTGKREAELAAVQAQRKEAEAGLVLARQELTRAATLASSGTAAQSRLDQARAAVAQYEARIEQYAATEQAGRLPGRDPEIEAARGRVREAEAALGEARRRRAELAPTAPADATVDDTYFDVGEWVAAGQPVVALQRPGRLRIRFFVPEAAIAAAVPGTHVTFTCDGCGTPLGATITHVSAAPEFTPPVIYSQEARAKLVFLTEARPDAPDPRLRPGLPVAVDPLP